MSKYSILFGLFTGLFLYTITPIFCEEHLASDKPKANNIKQIDPNPYFRPYMEEVHKEIIRVWHPENSSQTLNTVVLFRLNRSGKVLRSKITKPSGNSSFDKKVLNALTLAVFPPVPKGFHGKNIDINYDFLYEHVRYNPWSLRNSLNLGVRQPITPLKINSNILDEYIVGVEQKIMKEWQSKTNNIKKYQATIQFKIKSDGSIQHIKLIKSDGRYQYCKQVIKDASPFDPIPKLWPERTVTLQFSCIKTVEHEKQ